MAAAPPPNLLPNPTWFALGFFAVATVLFLAWWDHLPIVLQSLQPAWERDRKYLHPVWMGVARYLGSSALSLGLLALTEVAAWLAGGRMLAWIAGAISPAGMWGVLLALGLGHGLTGTLTAGFGFVGLTYGWLMWAVIIGALALAGHPRHWRSFVSGIGEAGAVEVSPAPVRPSVGIVDRGIAAVCAVVALIGLAGVFLPLGSLLNRAPGLFALFMRTPPDAIPSFVLAAAAGVGGCALVGWVMGKPGAGEPRWLVVLLAGCCAFFGLTHLTLALTPEWFYDSLVYHMAVPEQYLVNHKICYLGHTFISNYPFLQEMRYMFCLTLGNDVTPKLTHWADGLLCAAAAYALARPYASRTAAWLAAVIVLSAPTLRFLQTVTMVELGLTWFVALACMSLIGAMRWEKPGRAHGSYPARSAWLVLAGCFLGFGHGVKYIGLNASVLLLGWVFLEDRRAGRSWRTTLASQTLVIGFASIWTGVWLWKNWGFTGNPVFPFAHGLFPSLNWDVTRQHLWMTDNTKYGVARSTLFNWIGIPARLSTEDDLFGTFTFNPFPLLMVPLLFFYRSPPAALRFLGSFAGLFFVLWTCSSQQVRFLLPMLPEAAVVAAVVITRLGEGARLVRAELAAATGWIILMSMWGTVVNRTTSTVLAPYMTGHWTREEILHAALPYYDAVQVADARMGPHDQLLFVGGDESLYCSHNRICDSIYDFSTIGRLAGRSADPAELAMRLRRLRVTHLVVHERRAEEYAPYGLFDWSDHARKNFLGLWSGWLRPVVSSKGMQLFELARTPVPPALRKTGQPCYFYPQAAVSRAGGLIVQINNLLVAGKWDEALPLSDEMVKTVPLAAHALAYRGLILGQLHHPKEAMRDFSEAVRLGYPSGDTYFNLGRYQSEKRQFREALANFMTAAAIEPGLRQLGLETALNVATFIKDRPTSLQLAETLQAEYPSEKKYRDQLEGLRKGAQAHR